MRLSLLAQHADQGAFLWQRREAAARAPQHDMRTLSELDERVEANVDALRVAGDAGWEAALAAMDPAVPGSHFVAGAAALGRADPACAAGVAQAAAESPPLARAFAAALGWSPFEGVEPLLRELLGHPVAEVRRMGLAGYAAHRKDPEYALPKALYDADPRLRARALRAVGELGRVDLWGVLEAELACSEGGVRFAAAWSAALFGIAPALPVLEAFAFGGPPFEERAACLLVRCLPPADARALVVRMGATRTAAIAAGALGEPTLVPSMLDWMEAPELARVAGEAFTTTTGIEVARGLESPPPAGWSTEELAERGVLDDPDVALAWPAGRTARDAWAKAEGGYSRGVRHLLGAVMSPQHLKAILCTGRQRQRAGAALELGLRTRGAPVFEVRAPGSRQRASLRAA